MSSQVTHRAQPCPDCEKIAVRKIKTVGNDRTIDIYKCYGPPDAPNFWENVVCHSIPSEADNAQR
jgi:hypothetical protein